MGSILLVIVLFASANILYAQKDADEVAKAVETLRQGMIDGDKKALENIAADNLTYGHSSGLVEDKATFVDALVSRRSQFVTIALSEQSILVTGNTATVRHKHTGDVVNNGTPGKVNISVLLVWVKIEDNWKLLARQALKI